MPAKRYFEFSDGSKFWEVWREGASVFTRHGKAGANGQIKVKKASSDAEGKTLLAQMVADKTKEGYAEPGTANGKANGKSNGKAVTAVVDDVIVVPKGGYRLEVVEGKSSKFWEISRNEKTVLVTFGAIGTAGTTQKKKHKDEWEARSDMRQQVDEKVKKGYQFVMPGKRQPPPPPAAINPQLEAAIAKDPSSDDGYMVYADWLMQQNDPRGELATIQAQLAKSPKDTKLKTAQKKLLDGNRAFFWGPWAIHATDEKKSEYSERPAISASWRQGWIDSLRLSAISTYYSDDEQPKPPLKDCAELVRGFSKVTSARLVRELIIGCPVVEDEFHFQSTMKALAKVLPQLPALRRLVLGDFDIEDSELSWSHLGSMKELWPLLGKLEYLKIHAGSMDLAKPDAPELRELWIETGGFSKKNLASLLDANLPKLETLNLWLGQREYGCNLKPEDIAPLLDGKKFPKLKHLGLANYTRGNELLPVIAKSKILGKLETLDISRSHTTLAGIQELMKSAAAFKHLTKIDLSECLLNKEAKKLAATLCKSVDVAKQENEQDHRPEEGEEKEEWWRYSAVGE